MPNDIIDHETSYLLKTTYNRNNNPQLKKPSMKQLRRGKFALRTGPTLFSRLDPRTGLVDWIQVDVWTRRAIVKYKL